METVFVVVPIITGIFLVGFIYTAYFFVIPPFYHLYSVEYSRSGYLFLNSKEEKEIWILPAPRYTSYPRVCLSEDLTFNLNFSILSDPDCPINVRVCAGGERFSKNGTDISESLSQSLPLNFPRFPGEWLSRTDPPREGHVLYMEMRNLSQGNTTVYLSYSVVGHHRLGSPFNNIIVILGILTIGFTLLITLLHSATVVTKKIQEYKLRNKRLQLNSFTMNTCCVLKPMRLQDLMAGGLLSNTIIEILGYVLSLQ